jgi:hypothetical protein
MSNRDFKSIPYAPWLEQALQELILFPVKGICMFAVGEDGAIYSNYHDGISMMDKITIAGLIQQDAMMDALHANEVENDTDE